MEEECERNVMAKMTVRILYSVTFPLANMVIKQNLKQFVTCYFYIENMQLTVINFFEH